MFLLYSRNFVLLTFICACFFTSCGSSTVNENKSAPAAAGTASEFPFSTNEPEVYQGDFVVGNGKSEEKWFIARKGDKFRIDFLPGTEKSWIEIRADKVYSISPGRRIYAEAPGPDFPPSDPAALNMLSYAFFTGKEYRDFDDLGNDGDLKKYRVRPTALMHDDILIWIDKTSGMIVKQEFGSKKGVTEAGSQIEYVYEIRNLNLDVDDSVFAVPEGYRKVTWDEYRSSSIQK